MKKENFDEHDDDMVYTIRDIDRFKKDIKVKVWKNFSDKLESKLITDDAELDSFLKNGDNISELPNEILDYEVGKFIVIDDFDKNSGCIIKRDIFRLINRLTNEIIGNHLNKLVESGYLVMCWDDRTDEFLWRPTSKE